ncbi:MAG: hypothetical protein MI924_30945 [Chloroflexales bacterium]|nr:hypothetical protein [Chloroflexales bacterium]
MHLRARWYDPGSGTLTTRDPFGGFAKMPYSLHPYQYAYSNPVLWTDPTGEVIYMFEGGWHEPGPGTRMTVLRDYLEQKGVPRESMQLKRAHEDSIRETTDEVRQLFDGQYPAEPVILIGYSRGGMHAQAVAFRLNILERSTQWGITIALVITIAPVEALQPGWTPTEKQPIVRRHINILSEQGTAAALPSDPDTMWPMSYPLPEASISGTEEQVELGTSHFTVARNPMQRFKVVVWARDSPEIKIWAPDGPPMNPSPVFEAIETAIQAVLARR